MIQAFIIIFSCTSIALFASKTERVRRWGFVVGLAGQPFWIWSALSAQQWGILAVSIWFTLSHIRGIKNHWRKKLI